SWHAIRSERAETGNGQYVSGGWASPDAEAMWSVPVVTTPSMNDSEVLVIDPSQVALLDRQRVSTILDRAGNDLIENAITMRTELRSGLAVFSPSAVVLLGGGAE
ncbi:phage major capsid protein, partial [Streptomyces rhizosphaericus]|uniref:phage major capsid protein n=1 Tax=Streptomyces rhizosphaericus TaxID=114699 RepID=UPI0031CDB86A